MEYNIIIFIYNHLSKLCIYHISRTHSLFPVHIIREALKGVKTPVGTAVFLFTEGEKVITEKHGVL